MLRLVVGGIPLDLFQNDPITVEYQFNDLVSIGAAKSTFSQQFRVPLTSRNMEVFGIINDLSAVPLFDPKSKQDAVLYDGSIQLVKGFIQVKGFIKTSTRDMEMNVVMFGETLDMAKEIGDGKLTDLSLSAYDRTLDHATISGSWSGNKDIRFAVIDRGQNWQGVNTFGNTFNQVELFEPTGMMRVKALVDSIFSTAGLTYQSSFLTTMDDLYLMCNAGGQLNKVLDSAQAGAIFVGRTTADGPISLTATAVTLLSFSDTNPYYDPGNYYASGTYQVPFTGNYIFELAIACVTPQTDGYTRFYLERNGALTTIATVNANTIVSGQSWSFLTANQTYTAGDILRVKYQKVGTSSMTLDGNSAVTGYRTTFRTWQIFLGGAAWRCSLNLPDMKQIDFLMGLQRMFNLVFIPDRYRPNHYQIEPWVDYRTSGALKDWTDRVAQNKDITIEPTTDLQRQLYRYDMATGEDFISQLVKKRYNRPYGRHEVYDPDNDFATGESIVQSPFASWITSYIPDTEYPILRLLNEDGQPLDRPLPRLAFWNGLQDLSPWYMGGVLYTQFPVFTEMSDWGTAVDVDTIDLNFGYERKFHYTPANPRDALFYKYYYPMVGELYSSDARMVTIFMKLDVEDISQFEFSDSILIKNEQYRIYRIKHTVNDSTALTQVVLLRSVVTPPICNYIPSAIAKDGQVTFLNPSGTPVITVPRDCCELFGHDFDSNTSYCWGAQIQT